MKLYSFPFGDQPDRRTTFKDGVLGVGDPGYWKLLAACLDRDLALKWPLDILIRLCCVSPRRTTAMSSESVFEQESVGDLFFPGLNNSLFSKNGLKVVQITKFGELQGSSGIR